MTKMDDLMYAARGAGGQASADEPKLGPYDVGQKAFSYAVRATNLIDFTHTDVICVMAAWLSGYAAERQRHVEKVVVGGFVSERPIVR